MPRYGLLRDPQGNVKFDDWFNIPEVFNELLTEEDWAYIEEKRNGSNTPVSDEG